jgi:hypothetical protein
MTRQGIYAFAISVLLSGCGGKFGPLWAPAPPAPEPIANLTIPCVEGLTQRKDLAIIASKVSLAGPQDQSFPMMTLTDKPTEPEKRAITIWVNAREECIRLGEPWRKANNIHPQATAINNSTFARFLTLSADLYAGKLTYGEYHAARYQLAADAQREFANLDQRIREQYAAAQQAEAMRETMILMNVSNQLHQQRPSTTNCIRTGSYVNCTTY